jgi:hypothetical protein
VPAAEALDLICLVAGSTVLLNPFHEGLMCFRIILGRFDLLDQSAVLILDSRCVRFETPEAKFRREIIELSNRGFCPLNDPFPEGILPSGLRLGIG